MRGVGRFRGKGLPLNHHNHRTALTCRRTELMLVEVDVNGQSVQHTDIYKTMILAVEEDAMATAAA